MIITRTERQRGCGYRKPGGIYLVSDGIGAVCCKLPFELSVCPCCGEGIKQSRGFTWVSSNLFIDNLPCTNLKLKCPINQKDEKVGLMWVGEAFYPTPEAFLDEAHEMGVSKRIAQVPNDFEVGKTWIYLAHRKAITTREHDGPLVRIVKKPGIFQIFKPQRIEYIVKGTETKDEIARLEKRGFTLIKVIPDRSNELFN